MCCQPKDKTMKHFVPFFAAICAVLISSIQPQSACSQGARVTVSPTFITFGLVMVGDSARGTVIIRNSDTARFVHGSIAGPSTASFTRLGVDSFIVAPLHRDTVIVFFTPQKTGTLGDSLVITHDGASGIGGISQKSPVKVTLSGQGDSPNDTTARIAVSPPILIWNITVDSSATRNLIIHNTSPDSARYLYGSITGIHTPFSFANGNGTFNIADSTYDTVKVQFAPTAAGHFYDTLIVSSNADSANSRKLVVLSGTATNPVTSDTLPHISVLKTFFTWNIVVDSTATRNLVIRNISKLSTQHLFGSITGTHGPFSLSSETFDVADSAYDTVRITFAPTMAGQFLDTLSISSNADSTDGKIAIHLSGTATNPISNAPPTMSLTLSTSDDLGRMNFGSDPIGFDSIAQFTISDTSNTNSNLYDTLVAPSLPFSFVGLAAPSVIAAGRSRNVQVQFHPLFAGTYTDSVIVLTNSTTPRTVVPLFGIALAAGVDQAQVPVGLSLMTMPNPASDAIQITLNSTTTRTIALALYNDVGNKMGDVYSGLISPGARQFEYSISGLAAGSYFLHLESDGLFAVAKVVVRH